MGVTVDEVCTEDGELNGIAWCFNYQMVVIFDLIDLHETGT